MPVELSPTGEPAAPAHVGVALRAIGFGICFGLGITAAILWVVRRIQQGAPLPLDGKPSLLVFYLLLLAWLGGAGLATVASFSLMQPLASLYRRGGLSMVAGFATMVVSLLTQPIDQFFGPAGLLGLAALAAGGCLLLARSINRKQE